MFDLSNPYKAYQSQQKSFNQVEFMSPQQQITALYERCIELIDDTYEVLGVLSKSSEKLSNINKAISIINYLKEILVNEGDEELYNMYNDLYEFTVLKLRSALKTNERVDLDEAREQISSLAKIWDDMANIA